MSDILERIGKAIAGYDKWKNDADPIPLGFALVEARDEIVRLRGLAPGPSDMQCIHGILSCEQCLDGIATAILARSDVAHKTEAEIMRLRALAKQCKEALHFAFSAVDLTSARVHISDTIDALMKAGVE